MYVHDTVFPLVGLNKNDKQGIIYPALWKTQLFHKNYFVNFGDCRIVLVLNFASFKIFLNLFGCRAVRSVFCDYAFFEVLYLQCF